MTGAEAVAVTAAGAAAGALNAIVGSGTLITFPVLLAVGYSPVVANVSNTVGLVPGGLSGVHGYRSQLEGQGRRTARLAVASLVGAVTGAVLLVTLPPGAFKAVVPGFIAAALVLVVLQPWLVRRLEHRGSERPRHGGPFLFAGICLSGIYGGYFGAGQGILVISLLGIAISDSLQRLNGVKNVLVLLVNLVAALIFVFIADVAWLPAGLIAVGSVVGGQVGARVGLRLPAPVLRGVIVCVGIVAIVLLLLD
jgi:uncharacterized membrane protein YfcA